MVPTQRCFSIEREGDLPIIGDYCLARANFKDKFVFLFTNIGPYRYSLAEDKWEELPGTYFSFGACSLGDKVYVL